MILILFLNLKKTEKDVMSLIIGSLLLAGTLQLAIIFANWPIFIVIMMALGFTLSVTMPTINAYVGFRWKEKRSELFNVIYVGNNMGMAIGTFLAGLLATISFELTFFVNGLSTFGFAIYFIMIMNRMSSVQIEDFKLSKDTQNQTSFSSKKLLLNYKIYLFMGIGSMLNNIWRNANCSNYPHIYNRKNGLFSSILSWCGRSV
jgi:MFS family permease